MVRYLKKGVIVIFGCILIVSGCGGGLNPHEVTYKGQTLLYNDTNIPDEFWDDGIDIEMNDENKIRMISIENEEVLTYGGIKIGDSINKVKSKYSNESWDKERSCSVLFRGDKEIKIDPQYDESEYIDTIWLIYNFKEEKVNRIVIFDYEYGKYLR